MGIKTRIRRINGARSTYKTIGCGLAAMPFFCSFLLLTLYFFYGITIYVLFSLYKL